MNEIVNKFLLADDRFMPEMHLKQPGFTYSACCPFTEKELKSLWQQVIKILFIKMSSKKPAFNMIWLMANRKI